MGAILGGGAAALAWAAATLCSTRTSRALGPPVALAWVMAFGMLAMMPALALSPLPNLHGDRSLWLIASGAGNVAGLLMTYAALGRGPIGVVAPVVSAEGGVTALIAVAAGEGLQPIQAVAMLAALAGVVLVARRAEPPGQAAVRDHDDGPLAARWAAAAALTFGAGLYATGRAGSDVGVAWAVLPPRLIGLLVLTVPLGLRGQLRLPRAVAPIAALGGACEVAGFLAYAAGARDSIAVTAVLAGLTGAVAAGFARVLYAERLARAQLAGVALIAVGVAVLSGVSV